MNKPLGCLAIGIAVLSASCTSREISDPGTRGNNASAPAQGYWREVATGEMKIKELHLHDSGFSVTYVPFETYKDYWGEYVLGEESGEMRLIVDSGNELPEFKEATGTYSVTGADQLRISGIPLDQRRPSRKHFRFERFEP